MYEEAYNVALEKISSPTHPAYHTTNILTQAHINRRDFVSFSIASAVASVVSIVSHGAENKEEEDPEALLAELTKISGGSSLSRVEQGVSAARLIRRYTTTLEQRKGDLAIDELKKATDLAITCLYYPISFIDEALRAGGGDLTMADIDLDGKLIECCLYQASRGGDQGAPLNTITERLRTDLLWYSNYRNTPAIWELAAQHYQQHLLPGDEPIDLPPLNDILSKLDARNSVAQLIVQSIWHRVAHCIETQAKLLAHDDPERRIDVLTHWRELRAFFLRYFERDNRENSQFEDRDRDAFHRRASENLMGPFVEPLRQLTIRPCTFPERMEIGMALADGTTMEGGIEPVLLQIRKLGLTPYDAIATPRPTRKDASPYGVGPYATTFIDIYRGSQGAESIADAYATDVRKQPDIENARKAFCSNSASIYLAALQRFADEGVEVEYVSELMILARSGMKFQAQYTAGLPEMADWGERSALFIALLGLSHGYNNDEEWIAGKVHMMQQILLTGFEEEYPPLLAGKSEQVPGILTQFEKHLPEHICREFQIHSPEQRARVCQELKNTHRWKEERGRFIHAFRRALPHPFSKKCPQMLSEFGFTKEEIEQANDQNK